MSQDEREALIEKINKLNKRLDAVAGRPTSLSSRVLYYVQACNGGGLP
jgi:hypothetical protein